MKLILGSSSKHRKEILEEAGYVFDVLVPDVDEKLIKTDDAYQRPLVLARAKADFLVSKVKEPVFVVALDTVVVAEGKLCEKPESEKEARELLNKYSEGVIPETITAIVIVNTETGEKCEGVDTAKVFFKPFSERMIEDFIKYGEPMTRAGGFAVQHTVMKPFIDRIEGEEGSITGMPLHLLEKLLKEVGYCRA